ncbi:MAG: rRNA maturation RNase YbeY [Limisphaerales bacterium]|jgi:probable rRNA maturation factor
MPDQLILRNKSAVKVNSVFLKKILLYVLKDILNEPRFNLGLFLVNPKSIKKLNKQFLNHEGVTDVISFDYSGYDEISADPDDNQKKILFGEIYLCPQVAKEQSKRFKSTPSEEIIRYAIHGILHLKGFDDLTPDERKKMRKMENKLLCELKRKFEFKSLIGS